MIILLNKPLNSYFKRVEVKEKEKSMKEMIQEIHDTFYSEVNVLKEASLKRSLVETTKSDLIEKRDRLKKLGFNNTKECEEASIEINRLENLKRENKEKQELYEAIDYFSLKYPLYKFITEESVNKICNKYGLIYSTVDKYIGSVPDKNLKQMEEFKIKEEDECYQYEYIETRPYSNNKMEIKYGEAVSLRKEFDNRRDKTDRYSDYMVSNFKASPLLIAAPKTDFIIERNQEVKDNQIVNKIQIPDPIVLKSVIYKMKRYFLVVTAWGLEAGDEDVVNHMFN